MCHTEPFLLMFAPTTNEIGIITKCRREYKWALLGKHRYQYWMRVSVVMQVLRTLPMHVKYKQVWDGKQMFGPESRV